MSNGWGQERERERERERAGVSADAPGMRFHQGVLRMRKAMVVAVGLGLAVAAVQPAVASHAAGIVVAHSFAGLCGGAPTDIPGETVAGNCILGQDSIWNSAGPLLGPSGCQGGPDVSGCGQGSYLPGMGPPIVGPATPFRVTRTGCNNATDPACWRGGNYAQTTSHPAGVCLALFADAGNPGGNCSLVMVGSYYRSPTTGIGAYSGASEGCGRMVLRVGSATTVADASWIQSAGTILPIFMDVVGHSGTQIFSLTNGRPIRSEIGEPPGLGNGGYPNPTDPNTGPGKSGSRRSGVTQVTVVLPGDGPTTVPAGAGASVQCPDTF